jgi:hypothetical protein
MNKKKLITKGIITAIAWTIYSTVEKIYSPVFTNEMAVQQLNNTNSSFTNYQLWQNFWNYGYGILAILTVLFFVKDIIGVIKKSTSETDEIETSKKIDNEQI